MGRLSEDLLSSARIARHCGVASALTLAIGRLRPTGQLARIRVRGVPLFVRTGSPDVSIALETLGGEFEILRGVLPADFDGIIVDAGGYIGTAAIKLALMYPAATVLSFEASAENYAVLARNVAPYGNIRAFHKALVAGGSGPVKLFSRGRTECGFTTVAEPADCAAPRLLEEIDAVGLPDLLVMARSKPIGIVKMDIEGGELDMFRTGALDRLDPFALFVELHDRIAPGCRQAFQAYADTRRSVECGGEKFLVLRRELPSPS